MYSCMFGPFRSINIDEKCPNIQSTLPCNNLFSNMFLWFSIFRRSILRFLGMGGSKKCGVFSGTYFHVCMICMCFIERIGFYVHGLGVLFVWKHLNCELFRFLGCLIELYTAISCQIQHYFPVRHQGRRFMKKIMNLKLVPQKYVQIHQKKV